jgi:hypothetical protein
MTAASPILFSLQRCVDMTSTGERWSAQLKSDVFPDQNEHDPHAKSIADVVLFRGASEPNVVVGVAHS